MSQGSRGSPGYQESGGESCALGIWGGLRPRELIGEPVSLRSVTEFHCFKGF